MSLPTVSIEDLVTIYTDAELLMLRKIAKRLELHNMEASDWQAKKLSEVRITRLELLKIMTEAGSKAAAVIEALLVQAYAEGVRAAQASGVAIGSVTDPALLGVPTEQAVALQVAATVAQVQATHLLAVNQATNTFAQIVRGATIQQTTGVLTRREAAERALNAFAQQGISGFTDRAGRSWDLTTYVEASTRTAAKQASVNGQTQRLVDLGHDLVYVTNSPEECKTCRPWEGKILSLTGKDARYPTVADAKAGGLFHPNCTHALRAYFEGVTKPERTNTKALGNAKGYDDRQRLRRMERQVRASRRMEAAATSPAAKARAKARASAYQAKIRDHVAATDQQRSPHRERLTTAR